MTTSNSSQLPYTYQIMKLCGNMPSRSENRTLGPVPTCDESCQLFYRKRKHDCTQVQSDELF